MKIMFMGTPDFAVTALDALYNCGHEIAAVITTPDKPRGRGHNMKHTPVYLAAEKINAKVFTPENLKKENFEEILITVDPDIIVVAAYGKLLPEYVINYPKYRCVNIHGSLLPKYRGAAPIQRSIIDGEAYTGITTMYMEKGLDTGDMLLQDKIKIEDDDNFETVHDKLSLLGAQLIVKTLDQIENGILCPESQNDEASTYAHMITKETCVIDWSASAQDIHNLVRGLYPVPKAFTLYKGKQLKICKTKLSDKKNDCGKFGEIIYIEKNYFTVCCNGKQPIDIYSIQLEGKKEMCVEDFLRGNNLEEHIVLGG